MAKNGNMKDWDPSRVASSYELFSDKDSFNDETSL